MAWRVGVDSGGTFTDVCLYHEESGRFEQWKVPSTPEDPSLGIATSVAEGLAKVGAAAGEISYFGHGTTVATNSLIELRGAKTGLITTGGFRDLLEIGRQMRPSLYDMMAEKPPVLVPRRLRREVPERIRFDGAVETPLDLKRLRDEAARLADDGVEAVAICFLYGYLDPRHEKAAKEVVQEEFAGFVSTSHEIAPEFREFERLSATVVNAFLGPVMKRYIERLSERLRAAGMSAAPHMTQSNGGVIGFETAARLPVRTLLSGPSTGVVAAQEIARKAGFENVMTFDMGGTSSDVALLENLECKRSKDSVVHGYPIKTPMLDIHTVGAGGGSIAAIDSGGLLKVGPRSAGAVPGPACYGMGGIEATVTDANVVLQTLNPSQLLSGRMKLRRDLAHDAVDRLSRELGLGLCETAQGIISVATANMAKALRVVSVERGFDPREHALVAFGGGGPLHAARLAKELEIEKIVVPPTPGSLCALGLLLTDLKADFTASRIVPLDYDAAPVIEDMLQHLIKQAGNWFENESIPLEGRSLLQASDLRYAGQNYELQVPFPPGPPNARSIDGLKRKFEEAHRRQFGFASPDDAVELVALRLEAVGTVSKAALRRSETAACGIDPVPVGERDVWMPEFSERVPCPVFDRGDLEYGHLLKGPAIVEQMDTTTLILPDMRAAVDRFENLIMDFG